MTQAAKTKTAPAPRPAHTLGHTAQLFRAMGDEGRLGVLVLLLDRGELCVSTIAEATGEQVATVSQRLRVLRTEGLIRKRRDGKHIYYAIADAHVARLIVDALAHAEDCLHPAVRAAEKTGR